ncbi:cysteinyl-tRNA synthetase [Escherichia coli]|uniref:Cysteinyl-tRNA synthetase n=1 Tax=Escherichia coli TaxID=562 RepID=A0A377KAD0_ECOLX|nr:cysteinyl-tRNA synthetase [Escherichia coli]
MQMASHLRKLSAVLGLLEQEPEAFLQSGAQADDSEVAEIEALIQQRLDARKAKDWAAADAARDRLNEMGIVLEDGRKGPPGVVSNCAIAGCEFSHPVIRLRHHNIPISSIPGNHTHINSEIIT